MNAAKPCSTSASAMLRGPPSLSILEALCRRPGLSIQRGIVREVLSQWTAAKRIVVFLERVASKRRNALRKSQANVNQDSETTDEEGTTIMSRPTKRRRGAKHDSSKASSTTSKRGSRKKNSIAIKQKKSPEPAVDGSVAISAVSDNKIKQKSCQQFESYDSSQRVISHWLAKSLSSMSTTERLVACRVLVQGCPLDDCDIFNLLEVIAQVLCIPAIKNITSNGAQRIDGPTNDVNSISETKIHTTKTASTTSGLQHSCTCVVGWIGLLKHIVMNVLTPQQTLAYVAHPKIGLRWLTSTLWELAVSGSKSAQRQNECRRVCFAIIDLIHSLTSIGDEVTVPKVHSLLWNAHSKKQVTVPSSSSEIVDQSSNSNTTRDLPPLIDKSETMSSSTYMSPLAILIGTYHIWNEMQHEKFVGRSVVKLQQLIDPNHLPTPSAKSLVSNDRKQIMTNSSGTTITPTLALAFDSNLLNRNAAGSSQQSSATEGDRKSSRRNMGSSATQDKSSNPARPSAEETAAGNVRNDTGSNNPSHGQEDNHQPINAAEDGDEEMSQQDEVDARSAEVNEGANAALDNDDGQGDSQNVDDAVDAMLEEAEDDGDRSVESAMIDDDDDDDDIIHDDIEDEFGGFQQLDQFFELQAAAAAAAGGGGTSTSQHGAEQMNAEGNSERSRTYIEAAMNVLATQYPPRGSISILSVSSEKQLISTILNIVKPKKKPLAGNVILRRAPTQEEFFPRNLSKNPIQFRDLSTRPTGEENTMEPTVRDLRQYIADDLQMSEAAEMIEILVANKILDVDLKLRVVLQTVWKDHLSQGSGPSGTSFTSAAIVGPGGRMRSLKISATDTLLATYRLAGVDGEATEDTVSSADVVDPEAPTESSSPDEIERLLEKEYSLTRCVTRGRGVHCLLRSIEKNIGDTLRKIRRDDVGNTINHSRQHFKDTIFPGLMLLVACSKLPSNRKLLLHGRAPTALLSITLDTLHALQEDGNSSESNTTAKTLQELITTLASDISILQNNSTNDEEECNEDLERDASTLRHLVNSLENSSLSRPLRNVVAKLCPYLTYGKTELAKELASEFMTHLDIKTIGDYERLDNHANVNDEEGDDSDSRSVLMDTFIHTSVTLPSTPVCDSLRVELVAAGLVKRLTLEILSKCPSHPTPWNAALWSSTVSESKREKLEREWRDFSVQPGLKLSLEILGGLAKGHEGVQTDITKSQLKGVTFLSLCHWLETSTDNAKAGISIKHLSLVSETLLDEIADHHNSSNSNVVKQLRRTTRERKKKLALERRNKTLMGMKTFSLGHGSTADNRQQTAKIPPAKKRKTAAKETSDKAVAKPAWMLEMENLDEEQGLKCCICHEGEQSQPKECLGVYAFVRRVSLSGVSGTKEALEGRNLLKAIPSVIPKSLSDNAHLIKWHQRGQDAVAALNRIDSRYPTSSSAAAAISRRGSYYTTTVSAGIAIHTNCHTKAKQADKNHPKAPKTEWQGATLRNNRCQTNVIFPLLSSRSSNISLMTLESAMADHQSAIANMLGAMPQSILFNSLHDIRLLLLRLVYGESSDITAEVGGCSLFSNCQLLFYQLISADMHNNTSIVESPDFAEHARALSDGFLASVAISSACDYEPTPSSASSQTSSLSRGIANSAMMAALTCILLHNCRDDTTGRVTKHPSPNRRWILGKDKFLSGLLQMAGLRHVLGIKDSGCLQSRSSGSKRSRSASFADWDDTTDDTSIGTGKGSPKLLVEFGPSIRPFLCLYMVFDQLSADYMAEMDDVAVEEASDRLVQVIEKCNRAPDIDELINITQVKLSHEEILKEFNKGMLSA